MTRNPSPFNLGIIAAKKSKTLMDNPYDKSEEFKRWSWKEGFVAATTPNKDGVRLVTLQFMKKMLIWWNNG